MQYSEVYSPDYSDTKLSFNQDIIYRQKNIPRRRTYRIYPPASKKFDNPQSHKFNIATIKNKNDLKVSNLPLVERACLQKYDIKCNKNHYNVMIDATKYIFDAFSFDFEINGKQYNKTHYFSIAPNINECASSATLPTLYRTSICIDTESPKHYSFSTYAIVGGYSDGFYFMNRLDNNKNEYAHICKQKKNSKQGSSHKRGSYVVPFPHMHQPSFKYEDRNKFEFSTPFHMPYLNGKDMHSCLSYYLKYNNISPKMLLVREDMSIEDITEYARYFDMKHTLEDTDVGQLGKIVLTNVGNYEVSTETNDFHPKLPTQDCGAPYLRP